MAPYTPNAWVNNGPPALSEAHLNKICDELRLQATERSVSHTLPTWVNDAAPALTDSAPLNEMERVTQAVAADIGLTYTPTTWSSGWTPPRNATRLNRLEAQIQATRVVLDIPQGNYGTYNNPWGATSPWRTSAVGRAAHANSANMMSTLISGGGQVQANLGAFTCSVWSDTYRSFATAQWRNIPDAWFLDNVYYPTDYVDATSFGEWHAAWFDSANNRIAVSIKADSPSLKTFRAMNYMRIDGSGWWDNRIDYWAPRASGSAPNGGLLNRYDLSATSIDHALSCCIPTTIGNSNIILSPAVTTDQTGTGANGVPMGSCIVLSSSINVDTNPAYSGYSAIEKKMLKAIQQYGLYVTDSSSSFSIYCQNNVYGDQANGSSVGYPRSPLGGTLTLSQRWLQDSYIAVAFPNVVTYDTRAVFGGQPHH